MTEFLDLRDFNILLTGYDMDIREPQMNYVETTILFRSVLDVLTWLDKHNIAYTRSGWFKIVFHSPEDEFAFRLKYQ